jgi:hypothetical protein
MKKTIVQTTLLLLFATLISCSLNRLAGNGSEITNGTCMTASGPAVGALVVAYPHDYQLDACVVHPETTYADTNGKFSLELKYDTWNLLIYDRTQTYGAFIALRSGDSTVGRVDLDSLGYMTGTVSDSTYRLGTVKVPGSPFNAVISSQKTFSISKMPEFTYNFILARMPIDGCAPGYGCPGLPPDTVTHTVTIKAGGSTNIVIP